MSGLSPYATPQLSPMSSYDSFSSSFGNLFYYCFLFSFLELSIFILCLLYLWLCLFPGDIQAGLNLRCWYVWHVLSDSCCYTHKLNKRIMQKKYFFQKKLCCKYKILLSTFFLLHYHLLDDWSVVFLWIAYIWLTVRTSSNHHETIWSIFFLLASFLHM